jgi:Ser/Thr protein kinase RdoA (MazF antagonist)
MRRGAIHVTSDEAIAERAELTRVVRDLTGAGPRTWGVDKLHVGALSASIGIWRVAGDGWSTIVKLVGPGARGHPNWQAGEEPGHWLYWRREVAAYESGLVSSFAGALRPPRCDLVAERADGTVALWLEDLGWAVPGSEWALDRYTTAARHLGEAQGAYVAEGSMPRHAWLSRDWLRCYLRQRDADLELLSDPGAWRSPLARRWLSPFGAEALLGMRADRDRFLVALDDMPRTVCHLDLHPGNLFAADAGTVLIDWSFVGIGALGEDVGNLVPDAALDFHVDGENLDDLFAAVLDGYASGVRAFTGAAPGAQLELAMRATIAAKYAWIAPAMLRAAVDRRDTLNGRPVEETFARWSPVVSFLLRSADEARRLIDTKAQRGRYG